ncbi:putative cyclin-B2-1 [Penaeus vannamei]|uniref:Putative cyclin-B2-1 n=1 Tax=Penaeus vannamei TaxID=6689 RepID=A0A423T0I6_PENVA|nr:putative cyclin-B2-1 [Penaeus vannamei]
MKDSSLCSTSDLLQLTLNSYTRAELLSLERQVLSVLKFELSCADQGSFLNYFLYLTCNDQDNMVIDCSGFLLGIVLVEAWPLETRPSLLAAAALHGALVLVRSSLSATAVCTLMPAFFRWGAENKYSSRSRHNALAKHPRLSPENIRLVVEQVRMRVVELRGENTVIRDRLSDGGEKKREASEPVCSARDKFSLADAFVDGMRVGGIHERGVEMDLASERREKNGEEKQGEREMDVDI